MNILPISKEVVLLGGGHAHVIVIRKWAMNPIEGVRVTLVSEQGMTPYSGMLPGLVAGHYSYTQSHIDLPRLCQWANVRFIEQRATGVNPDNQTVLLGKRPGLHYDILSIDTGGAPAVHQVKGAAEFATAVKPVSSFYARWLQIEQRLQDTDDLQPMRIGVVGAGAGGFEILLAMHNRIANAADKGTKSPHRFHWIIRGDVLPGASERVRRFAIEACKKKGITLETGFNVDKVEKSGLVASNGRRLPLDEILWCTEARAADWPAQSGLACSAAGFIRLNDHLQSVSHSNVFAAGDVAVQDNNPRPRAGVFAVRQGPPLFENLQNAALGRKLVLHRPQKQFLTLLSLGNKRAIASRGMLSIVGKWVWRWKDHIDQTFMDRFNVLPEMHTGQTSLISRLIDAVSPPPQVFPENDDAMRCSGCGSKVPGDILHDVLSSIPSYSGKSDTRTDPGNDDVAIVHSDNGTIAQSLDQLRAILNDPWLFARITTLHALSDLYASNLTPHSALLNITLPFASEAILRSDLAQVMSGIVYELDQAGCRLAGGHTTEGAEFSLGLVVNGVTGGSSAARDSQMLGKSDVREGQAFILTKPLGIGVLMAAHMRGQLPANDLEDAVQTMLMSNRESAKIAAESGATAMTDVTGFGLVGHLSEMLLQSNRQCELDIQSIPILASADKIAIAGQHSSLYQANARYSRYCDKESALIVSQHCPLCFDPQTSGGLLFSLPEQNASRCIEYLHAAGYTSASIIGRAFRLTEKTLVPDQNEGFIRALY